MINEMPFSFSLLPTKQEECYQEKLYPCPVFEELIPLLKVLEFKLSDIMLSHPTSFHFNCLQEAAVTQHLFTEQLQTRNEWVVLKQDHRLILQLFSLFSCL